MRLRATPLYIALIYCIFFNVYSVHSQIKFGADTTLPCGVFCFNLSATLDAEYKIDSTNISFASHEPFTFGSSAGISSDNVYSSSIALPFTFCYYGQNYNNLVIGSNGIISFNTTLAGQPCNANIVGTLPSNTYDIPSIMPAFHDLNPAAGQITYGTVGSAPNQKFVINYNQVPQGGTCSGDLSTFQVILDEATGAIEFYIQDKPACLSDVNSGRAICGLQNSNTQAITIPGKDGTNVWGGTAFNKAYRFVPNGLPIVQMIGFFGNLSAPATLVASGTAIYTATFNNICPTYDTATYMVRVLYDHCGDTSIYYDTILVNRPTPIIGSYSFGNPTTCNGTNGTITLGGLLPSTQYAVVLKKNTVPQPVGPFTTNGFGSLTITGLGIGTYDDIRVVLNSCQSNNAGPVTLSDPPAPAIGSVTKTDPDSCGVANGSITLTGLQAGGTYTVNMLKNTVAQAPVVINADGSGNVFISNLGAGAYAGITVTRLNCTSNPEAITLSDPALPVVTASNNGPLCEGAALNLMATLVTGVTYSWTGPNSYVSSNQNPTIGTTVLADAGTYTVTASINNCTSLPSNTVVAINPLPTVSGGTPTSPTTCLGTNGYITFTGLTASTSYSIAYNKNTIAQTPVVISSNASGVLVMNNLSAGTYSNIVFTGSGCSSLPQGPYTINDPAPPAAPTAGNNGPLCIGSTLNLSASTIPGVTYSWTGPSSFTSTTQNPTISNAQSVNAGIYSVTATANNCTSTAATTTVVINPIPVIGTTSSTNPTTCSGVDGTITLNGLTASTSYTVNYLRGGVPQSATIVTNGSGSLVITGLNAATYSNITVSLSGCTSAAAGPIVLSNPPNPPAPTAGNNGPLCAGATLNLSASTIAGASYSWSGPASFGANIQNPSVANVQATNAGVYTVIAIVNGCPSAPANTTVVINPLPTTTGATPTGPTTCSGTNGYITFTGLTANASYTINYTKNTVAQAPATVSTNASGVLVLNNLTAGSYDGITFTLNGCTSVPVGPYVVNDPTPPAVPVAGNNGPVCAGATLTLSASTIPGVTYSWTGPNSFAAGTQNPTRSNMQAADAGVYSVTATANNCPSAAATTTVVVNPLPVIASVVPANPTTCSGTNGSVTLTGLTASTSYNINYTKNSAPQSATISTNSSGSLTIPALGAGTYANITATLNGCISASAGPVTLSDPTAPATPIAGSNGPICAGASLNLTASTISGASYSWTGPNSFTANTQNPSITNTPVANAGVYSVTATVNNCVSTSGTVTVVVNPLPTISGGTATSPTTCLGTNGFITFTGLTASASYTVNYSKNTVAQAPVVVSANASGVLVLNNLSAGTYSNITFTLGSCTSAPAGPYTITDPAPPAAPTAGNNGPLCAGNTLNLTASTIAGASYNWTGPNTFTATTQNPSATNITSAGAGVYSVTATVNNCVSSAATTTVVVNPLPVIASTSFINPTTCSGANGSITLNGLAASTSYSVNYLKNTVAQSATLSTNSSGALSISALTAGSYTNITVSLNGCASAPAGPITLTDPSAPAAPVAGNNGPLCVGTTLNLTASTVAGATYSWTGPSSFTANAQNPSRTNVQVSHAGVYSVVAIVSGCTSAAATTTVVVNPVPAITAVTPVNPTTCSGTNGTISLTGLTANATYTVNYTKNTNPVSGSFTANGTGVVTITTLTAGTYANITVTLNGCTSAAAGPVTLTDPAPPVVTASNNGPLCAGATLNLSATTIAGATYSWTGPGTYTSGSQNPSITGITAAQAGTYTVTATLNNCTSLPSNTTVVVNPIPATPVAGNNGPICAGSTLNLTASTVAGATYAWTGPSYTSAVQNPSISNAPATASGIYSVTATANGCTSPAATTTVVVNAIPAAPVAASNSPVCAGSALNLTASTITGATYSWTGPSYTANAQNPVISNATIAASGVYSVTATANGCTSPAATTTVVVNALPAAPTTANISYCQFATATALTATGTNLKWYTAATGGTALATAPTPATTTAGTTTWYVSQTTNSCEGPRSALTVTVIAKPAAPVAALTITYCQGQPATPLSATGTNLQWYTVATGGTASTSAPTPSTTTPGTTTYYVSQIVNGCESDRAAIAVTVGTTPANPIVTSPVTYCESYPATPALNTFVTGTNLKWYTTATGGTGSATPPTVNTAVPGTTTYYVSQSNTSCESGRTAIVVNVNAKPLPPAVANVTYCQVNTPVPLTAAGTNLKWYTTATGGTGTTTAPTPSTAVAGTFNFYVSQTVSGCESDRAQIAVTIFTKPPNPSVTGSYNYCEGEPTVALNATGTNLLWYTSATGGTGSTAVPTPSSATAGVTKWYVSQTVAGCESDRAQITVTVNAKPQAPVANTLYYCEGDAGGPVTANGQNLLWYTSLTGGTGSATAPVQSTATTGTFTYYVSQTVAGCESGRATLTVVVSGKVTASFTVSKDTLCQSDTVVVTFTGTAPASATYNWNFNGATILSGTGAGPYMVRWPTDGAKEIELKVDNANCSATSKKKLSIKYAPIAYFNTHMDACLDQPIEVTANMVPQASYSWSFSGADIISGSGYGPYKLKWKEPGPKTVTLVVFNLQCSSVPFIDTLDVHPVPVAKIEGISNSDVCSQDTISLKAMGSGKFTYEWLPQRFFTTNNRSEVTAVILKEGYINLNVTDGAGCTASDSVYIKTHSCCDMFLPDAFSPNGDGRNDIFRALANGNRELFHLRVANRWGQIVFETSDPTQGWDGNFKGEPQGIGTYQYYVRFKCSGGDMNEKSGSITLLR